MSLLFIIKKYLLSIETKKQSPASLKKPLSMFPSRYFSDRPSPTARYESLDRAVICSLLSVGLQSLCSAIEAFLFQHLSILFSGCVQPL